MQREQSQAIKIITRTLQAAAIAGSLFACNSITGAGNLIIDDGAGGSTGSNQQSGPTGSRAAGTGPTTATNGASVGAGAGPTTGAGTGSTGATGPSTGASTADSTAAVTAGASTGSGMACMYPPGPYGITIGSVIDPSFSWSGYPEGANTPLGTITPSDLYDCDGSKHINAVLIDVSAVWCGACQQEAMDLPSEQSQWTPMGIHVVTLLIEDANANPATAANAKSWKDNYGLDSVGVAANPNYDLLPPQVGLPYQIIVDPRTMKIVQLEEGFSGQEPDLVALAQKNGP